MRAETSDAEIVLRRSLRVGSAVVVGLWLVVLLAWSPAPFALTFDDAYYYFEIAKNFAAGEGSTFDGINQTNGYHPLWMLVSSPVYLAGLDGLAAVRTLLVFQLLVWGATLLVVTEGIVTSTPVDGGTSDDAVPDGEPSHRNVATLVTAVLVLIAANPFFLKIFVNGLESGIAAFFEALLLVAIFRSDGQVLTRTTARDRLAIGALMALGFLARTDVVVLIGCIGLWSAFEVRELGHRAIRALVEIFAIPLATVVSYLLFNHYYFGDPRQISGEVKRLSLTAGRAGWLIAFVLVAALLGIRARRRLTPSGRSRMPRTSAFTSRTGWFAAFCVLIVGYYVVLSAQQWLWYFAPVALYLLVLALVATADMGERALVEAPAAQSTARAVAPLTAILLVPLAVAGVLQIRAFADPHVRSIQEANRDAGTWISENLPPDAVLVSWDAGVVGYFSEQPVVNIDGVVNSYEFRRALRTGTTATFLENEEVGWIVNHATAVEGKDPNIGAQADALFGSGAGDGIRLEQSWPFLFSGQIEGAAVNVDGLGEMAVFLHELPRGGG